MEIRPIAGQCWAEKRKPDRQPATYTRTQGVRHLLAAYDLKDDKLYAHNKARKTHKEFLQFLKILRRRYSRKERLYIVLDNFSPHHKQTVKEWAAVNNIELVYTPTYASWLNRIECHFGPLRKFVLRNSNYKNHKELAKAIQEYIRWRNRHAKHPRILKEQNKVKVA